MCRTAVLAGAAFLGLLLATPTAAALGKMRIATGFDSPTYVTAAPGNVRDIFVVEQPGRIIRLHDGKKTVFLDIRGRVRDDGNEQGLLSMAFHPRFQRNHRFFVDYTNNVGDTRVARFRTNNAGTRGRRSTARIRLRVKQPFANHNGGQLQFGRDGRLYISMGDGGSGGDPGDRAQNPRKRLGKLLSLNVDNPRAKAHIVALGLRNPWRFSVDAKTGVFWIGDVGQNAWEEIDRFHPGNSFLENYGWNVWEGTHRYSDSNSGDNRITKGRLIRPVHEYGHAHSRCSVTGGYMVRGTAAGAGRYFFGDFCAGTIWSFRYASGRKSDARRHRFSVDQLTSFGLDGRRRLLMVSRSGEIFRLVRR